MYRLVFHIAASVFFFWHSLLALRWYQQYPHQRSFLYMAIACGSSLLGTILSLLECNRESLFVYCVLIVILASATAWTSRAWTVESGFYSLLHKAIGWRSWFFARPPDNLPTSNPKPTLTRGRALFHGLLLIVGAIVGPAILHQRRGSVALAAFGIGILLGATRLSKKIGRQVD